MSWMWATRRLSTARPTAMCRPAGCGKVWRACSSCASRIPCWGSNVRAWPSERLRLTERRLAQSRRAGDDRVEYRLDVGRRLADDLQNLGRSRLLFLRLRQALLQVADPRSIVLGRLAGDRGLGSLGLGGLWTPAHWPPLASYESAGDRLGERACVGKCVGRLCWCSIRMSRPNCSVKMSSPHGDLHDAQ